MNGNIVVINRNSGIFDKATSDQLNSVFNAINKKIDSYKSVPLAYKEDVQLLNPNGNSFRCGQLVCIREGYKITQRLDNLTKVGELLISVPYELWTSATTAKNDQAICRIYGNEVFMQASFSEYPQTAYISFDFVIPQTI